MDPNKFFEDNMNNAIQKLTGAIIPSDDHIKNANVCANNIVKLLQRKSYFKVGQVCIAGSAGKKTTIYNSDVDCVVFINEQQPPFKDVLEDFENILSMTDSFQIRDVKLTKYSIQLKANNFDFDILPAANFFPNCEDGDGDHLNDLQQRETLNFIKTDPKKFGVLYSGSLAKATINFMKRQDGFVHEMVRLSKFWYKTLYFDEYISGAKSLIELVAVHTAIKERNYDSLSYLRCFTQVLKYLQNFEELNIVFEKEYKFPEHQILDNSLPRVLDPVNPYNNFAKNWHDRSIKLIKQYANETYRRLQFLAQGNIIRLDMLFEPQPTYLPILSEIFAYTNNGISHWLVGSKDHSLLPDLTIRNENVFKDIRFRSGLDILKNYFQYMMHSIMASPNWTVNDAKQCVQNIISRSIMNKSDVWVAGTDNHEDFDVTLTVPLSNGKAIQISYRL